MKSHYLWIFAWCCLLMGGAQSQTTTTSETTQQRQGADTGQATPPLETAVPVPAQDDVTVVPLSSERSVDNPGVQVLGGQQNWFSRNFDWFHWGPIGITSAELFYTYSEQDGPGEIPHFSAGVLQSNIAFSHKMRHSWLILQYEPRVLYVDGRFSHPLSNQDSTLDLLFAPAPHFTIGMSESFNYYGGQNILNDRTLTLNQFTGAITNPFLNNGNRTIANSFGIPMSYSFSAKTTVSVSPFANYLDTTPSSPAAGAPPLSPPTTINNNMLQYGVRTQFNHVFSPNQSAGVFYSYQVNQERDFTSVTHFQSFGFLASRRIGRSLVANATMGASYGDEQPVGQWTGVGSLTLTRSFRHSALQGTAGRNATFTGLVGSRYSNYAWVNYSHTIGRRTELGAGFGYLSGSVVQQSTNGKYVLGKIDYRLAPNMSWFFAYARYMQAGGAGQLNIGNQSQFQSGFRWSPRTKSAY